MNAPAALPERAGVLRFGMMRDLILGVESVLPADSNLHVSVQTREVLDEIGWPARTAI
jgi:hypothetical protein